MPESSDQRKMWLIYMFKVAIPGNRLQYKRMEPERQARLIFQKPHGGTILGLVLSEWWGIIADIEMWLNIFHIYQRNRPHQ